MLMVNFLLNVVMCLGLGLVATAALAGIIGIVMTCLYMGKTWFMAWKELDKEWNNL